MQTPLQEIEARTSRAIREALGIDAEAVVAPAQIPTFGDYQSNAAMQIAGRLKADRGEKANPRQIAEQIVARLGRQEDLLAAPPTIAGPGFINFTLSQGYVTRQATSALADANLGVEKAIKPQRVVVEYSSPNIAKQMHVGHIRSTILGDCAARVLEFLGHDVIRQNHVGDWGTQFGMLIEALREVLVDRTRATFGFEKWYQADNTGRAGPGSERFGIFDLEEFYRAAKTRFDADPQFRERSRLAVVQLQSGDADTRKVWAGIVEESRQHFLRLYHRLDVTLERSVERGESFYNPRLQSLAEGLLAAGVAVRDEGAIVSFAGGFKAPLMIQKTDGGFGYGTTDLAAVEFRTRCDEIPAYGQKGICADRVIYFVDARQTQHFKQIFATARAAAEQAAKGSETLKHWRRVLEVEFEHASFGSVLGEDGTPIKTREGESVKLADLLDEAERRARAVVDAQSAELPDAEKGELARAVGIGAVKYADLSKDRTSDYVFSYDQMLALDGNTAPYLQYAHARIRSIHRKADEQGVAGSNAIEVLAEPAELALAKHLLSFGDVVRAVGRELKPHLLCTFLYEAARRFSVFYENCPVLRSEGRVRESRLALTDLTGRTLALGLDLLGIAHPQRM